MDNIFRDNDLFVAVYIDDILVFSKNTHKTPPNSIKKYEKHGIIISKSINNLWISFSQIFNNQTNKSLYRKYFITCLNCLS